MSGVVRAALRLELRQLASEKAYVALTVLAAVTFLAMTSLFGLTASDAPMALVVHDRGPYAVRFVEGLVQVPHAFRLKAMSREEADAKIARGDLAGAITIPAGFSAAIAAGETVAVEVDVDNVNVDLVTDIQRSLPAAIVAFGQASGFPGLRVRLVEHDVWPRDTSFLPYVTVSGLGLAALVIASVLGAIAVARDLEARTTKAWRLAPVSVAEVLAGKLAAVGLVGLVAASAATLVVVAGYGVVPAHPVAAVAGIAVAVASFTCLGAYVGALTRRTLVLVPLLFGLAMPLYVDSGALEPTRFDGETIWLLSHLTPLYYVVGWLEWAFFDVVITPEPMWLDLAVPIALGAVSFGAATRRLARRPT